MTVNTIEALQGLYVALGGDITDVANITTIPDMLMSISTVAAAAAGGEVETAKKDENGKDLTSYVAGATLRGTDLILYDGNTLPVGDPIDLSSLIPTETT